MAKNFAIDLSAININTVAAESRKPITSAAVKRPVREIRGAMNKSLQADLMGTIFKGILALHGSKVDAKGATWIVDHDDCARVLRTSYNLHLAEPGEKMDSTGAREVWTQIWHQAHPPKDGEEPAVIQFNESDNADSEKDE